MILASVLFVLGFLAVLVMPIYYLIVAKPWGNPIGRLMLVQQMAFVLIYSRSAVALLSGIGHLATDAWSLVFTVVIDGFLISIPIVHEYVRRKARRDRRRLQR